LGILPIEEALSAADKHYLDLVEVSPNANPPVCRIMDFGKYQYELSKKEKESKKKQHTIVVKEIRMRPKTDHHDLETKLRQARKFFEQKNKVKFSLIFKGREMAYQETGKEMLEKVIESLEDIAKPDAPVKLEGRRMVLIMSNKS
jgi:translation initiation factor IF-3